MKTRTCAQWVGAFYRKSIPLCKEHYILLHVGNLSHEDIKRLSEYKGKILNRKKRH